MFSNTELVRSCGCHSGTIHGYAAHENLRACIGSWTRPLAADWPLPCWRRTRCCSELFSFWRACRQNLPIVCSTGGGTSQVGPFRAVPLSELLVGSAWSAGKPAATCFLGTALDGSGDCAGHLRQSLIMAQPWYGPYRIVTARLGTHEKNPLLRCPNWIGAWPAFAGLTAFA